MSQQQVRGVQSKVLKRIDGGYEAVVNGTILSKLGLDLESILIAGDMIQQGWNYVDSRPQTIAQLPTEAA